MPLKVHKKKIEADKKLSMKGYIEKIRPHLRDMMDNLKKPCEQKMMTDNYQKLICNLYDKTNFVVQIKALKLALVRPILEKST